MKHLIICFLLNAKGKYKVLSITGKIKIDGG
ncbi:hypothetical protein ACSSV5_000607 [Psychroflexus sp. MBR-150]